MNNVMKLLVLLSVLGSAYVTADSIRYVSPTGEIKSVPTLFGLEPNPEQATEEWLPDEDYGEVYAGLMNFDMRFTGSSQAYVKLHASPLQKVIFENGRYRLLPSDINLEQFNALPVFDKQTIERQSQRYIEFRTANMNKPNLSLEYRRETVEGCGTVKFMYRSDASGRSTAQEIVFEKLGKLSISTYQINKITCTASGQIILQLAIFEATGGKKDYFINKKGEVEEAWDYRPAIAIVETGISN